MAIKRLKCISRVNMLKSKIKEKKNKPPFLIYAIFKSVIVPQANGKQNPIESLVVMVIN